MDYYRPIWQQQQHLPLLQARYDSNNNICHGIGAIMDYFQPDYNKWSTCSKEDFTTYYNSVVSFLIATSLLKIILFYFSRYGVHRKKPYYLSFYKTTFKNIMKTWSFLGHNLELGTPKTYGRVANQQIYESAKPHFLWFRWFAILT